MDGFAIRSADLESGVASFRIVENLGAGDGPERIVERGEASRIMTGAVVPRGADRVVPVELCGSDGNSTRIDTAGLPSLPYVARRGEDARQGEILLKAGEKINQAGISVLASVGKREVKVYRRPKVRIVSTGNEVVDVGEVPLPHQIRDCNTHLIAAFCLRRGLEHEIAGVVPDDPVALERVTENAEDVDLLVLSGGVSMGEFDFVPETLRKAGVENLFHRVAIKPGKPVWFGASSNLSAFGLPGNPVSVMATLKLFVEPFVDFFSGAENFPVKKRFPLAEAFENPYPLDWLVTSRLVFSEKTGTELKPVPVNTSGDFVKASLTDGFFRCPPKARSSRGEPVEFLPWQ